MQYFRRFFCSSKIYSIHFELRYTRVTFSKNHLNVLNIKICFDLLNLILQVKYLWGKCEFLKCRLIIISMKYYSILLRCNTYPGEIISTPFKLKCDLNLHLICIKKYDAFF